MSYEDFKKSARRTAHDTPTVTDLINAALVATSEAKSRYGLDEVECVVLDSLRNSLYLMSHDTPVSDVLSVHARLRDLGVRIADFRYASVDDAPSAREAYAAYLTAYQHAQAALRRDSRM